MIGRRFLGSSFYDEHQIRVLQAKDQNVIEYWFSRHSMYRDSKLGWQLQNNVKSCWTAPEEREDIAVSSRN